MQRLYGLYEPDGCGGYKRLNILAAYPSRAAVYWFYHQMCDAHLREGVRLEIRPLSNEEVANHRLFTQLGIATQGPA